MGIRFVQHKQLLRGRATVYTVTVHRDRLSRGGGGRPREAAADQKFA